MVDVTVVGAGIFGLSIGWACAARGAKVQVLDTTGIAAGCSGGVVGMLAPHAPEKWNPVKQFQFDSLAGADRFWQDVARTGGRDPGYARVGRLQPLQDDAACTLAGDRALAARAHWQGRFDWQVIDHGQAQGLSPDWVPASPSGYLIYDTLSARLHPRQACAALAAAIQARGGRVVSQTVTPGMPLPGQVVWATGLTGLRDLNQALGKQIGNGVKGQAAVFGLDARGAPIVSAGDILVVPHADGTVAVGSTSERDYAAPDHTDALLDALLARAAQVFPILSAAPVIERWAGLRPRSRSRAPMLGAHPLYSGQFIANGGFKIGFGMAPHVAKVMADLVLDGCPDGIPQEFRPEASL